ncbi:MAG: DUF547 domain-containing protein [Gammaproteobacteria bacterium]|nr:MAG: DUF547 domain-containing protein [Gammaproteobacteria bacterium]
MKSLSKKLVGWAERSEAQHRTPGRLLFLLWRNSPCAAACWASLRLAQPTFGSCSAGSGLVKVLLLASTLLLAACGPEPDTYPAAPFNHQHTLFDQVLTTYVKDGLVSYKALKNDQETLNRYLGSLTAVTQKQYEEWTRHQKLAFWINAYNAFTIKVILNNYPVTRSILADPLRRYPPSSIRQIRGVWKGIKWPVMGTKYTLDYMEHVIMRQEIIEPRIHFVLVCASLGCPLLESRAFDPEHLEQRLDQAAINYIYRDQKVEIDRENGAVRLPQIFNWFWEDFKPFEESAELFKQHPDKIAGPLSWIYHYASADDHEFLRSGSYQVSYLDYDWGLNELE